MRVILFSLLICLMSIGANANNDYGDLNSKHKLKVTRIPTDSGFDALKITFEINSDIATFQEVISDVDNYHSWVYNCISSVKILKEDKGKRYYVSKIDFPSPMKDRIFAAESTQYLDADGSFVSISRSITETIEHGDYEPFEDFNAKWIVKPLANDRLYIEYYVSSRPGGTIPSYIYNFGVEKGPVSSVRSLIKLVESKGL